MKQRVVSILILAALIISLLPQGVLFVSAYSDTDIAYPVEGGNIYFAKTTGTITDCDESVTKVDIPSEIDGVAVKIIGDYAFYNCDSLYSVTIPSGVTSISNCAFTHCSCLMEVTIPDSVTNIGISAFNGCSSLTSATIPNGVTSIGSFLFFDCNSLEAKKQ